MAEKFFIPKDCDLLDPKEDSTFKTLFIQEGEKTKIALKSLIKAIIGREPRTVQVIDSELPKNIKKAKDIRLDLQCKMEDGDLINIEMQTCMSNDNLKNRVLYYASRMMSTIDMKGKSYSDLPKVYHVMFTNFQLFDNHSRYLQTFRIQNDDQEAMSECMQFIFIQMNMFQIGGKKIGNLLDIEKWIIFLRDSTDKEKRDLLNSVMSSDEGIREAGEILMAISKDIKAWARQEMRFKARQDREAEEVIHRRELKQFEDKVKQAEEQLKQFEKQAIQAEEQLKQFEEQAKQAEEQVKIAEEQAKQFEEKAKQAEEQVKLAEEQTKQAKSEAMETVVRSMKAKNIPVELITEITGMTAGQIDAL